MGGKDTSEDCYPIHVQEKIGRQETTACLTAPSHEMSSDAHRGRKVELLLTTESARHTEVHCQAYPFALHKKLSRVLSLRSLAPPNSW